MTTPNSDAFVFFGATGDLAYKKIFPALQALIKAGSLNMPIVGVARAGWSLDRLRNRARDSFIFGHCALAASQASAKTRSTVLCFSRRSAIET